MGTLIFIFTMIAGGVLAFGIALTCIIFASQAWDEDRNIKGNLLLFLGLFALMAIPSTIAIL